MTLEQKIASCEAHVEENVFLIQNQNGAFFTEEKKWSFFALEAEMYKTEAAAEKILESILNSPKDFPIGKRPPKIVNSDDVCSYGYEVEVDNELKIKRVWTSTKLFSNVHFENYFKNDIEADIFVEEYPQRAKKKKDQQILDLKRKLKELESEKIED